jgi:hippurate hydrolase
MTIRALAVALLLGSVAGRAADVGPLRSAIRDLAEKDVAYLAELYRHLHANPELSQQERATAERLAKELAAAGYAVTTGIAGHGLVGVLRNGEGPTVLIRADMDGLPVEENTGRPYASRNRGVMHACGHDMHMSCFIGAARALAKLKDRWRGTLLMAGQPAEETIGGAKQMVAAGIYTRFARPDYCLALHVDASLEAGRVGYREGFMLAAVDSVDITIRGLGGHGAYPHRTKDPIVLAAQVVVALQTIVSREVRPIDAAVVTVGSIHGGTKRNVIPDQVELQLTVRTYSEQTRRVVLDAIERITKGMARAAGIPPSREPVVVVREDEAGAATYNNPELTRRAIASIREMLGSDRVVEREPEMGAEDFGLFGKVQPEIPVFMFRLGTIDARRWAEAQKPGGPSLPSLHSSQYWPEPELSLRTGVEAMTAAALGLLK